MNRIISAELTRFARRRTLIPVVIVTLLVSAVSTIAVFSSADNVAVATRRGATPIASLVGHGGGTEAFAVGASFAGFFVFVVFIAVLAGEFSSGTFQLAGQSTSHFQTRRNGGAK